MTHGTVLLNKYLKRTGQRASHLSKATGIEKSLLCRWIKGEENRRPGIEHACKLEKHTKGAIPVCAWIKEAK